MAAREFFSRVSAGNLTGAILEVAAPTGLNLALSRVSSVTAKAREGASRTEAVCPTPFIQPNQNFAMADPINIGCSVAPDADPQEVITNMVQERGRISQSIYQMISVSLPFVKVLEPTKEEFPSARGDVYTEVIFDIARPQETDVLDWQRVKAASPGYNPCCVQVKEIPYGSRTVSACLYRDAWKTPEFCKIDLAFKYERAKQIRQQYQIMAQWTKDIWAHWSVVAFQRSVVNVTLNGAYGMPENLGAYPTFAMPSSILTFHHLEEIYRRIKGEGGELGRVVEGHELVFIGPSEFAALEENYLRDVTNLGFRSSEVVLPAIGSVRKIDKYMFVLVDCPRRFRRPTPGETFEDCIINSTIRKEGPHGTYDARNPDYYNPEIAEFSEFLYFNASAVAWLVPPSAMTGADQMYPMSDFSGEFMLVNPQTENNVWQEIAYFAARYMAGMIARFPARARAGLANAVHGRYKDVCVDADGGESQVSFEQWPVLDCAKLIGQDRLQLLVKKGTLPSVCPDGHSLFLVSRKGKRFLVNSIISQEAYAGDEINTEGGTMAVIDFPTGLEAAATCREDCDPWEYLACLPAATASDNPASDECTSCTPVVPDTCTFTAVFHSDNVLDLVDGEGSALLGAQPGGGYTASTFEAAVNNWLDGIGDGNGTAVVTEGTVDNDFRWSVTITGTAGDTTTNTALSTAEVVYEDGLYEAGAGFVQTGDCTGA